MIICESLSNDQLIEYIYKAAAEYENLIDKKFLIIGKNKNTEYFYFECFFEKKNFMHLLGIKSKTLSATKFYEKCVNHNKEIPGEDITISDCSPAWHHDRKTINKKVSCCKDILRIQEAKYMKTGDKNLITEDVDFDYAYGNEAILGFFKKKNACFPITLIPNSINKYSSRPVKVVFILEKSKNEHHYSNIKMEIRKGAFEEDYSELPDILRNKITLLPTKEECQPQ